MVTKEHHKAITGKIRLFVNFELSTRSTPDTINKEQSHYLTNVMRVREKQEIILGTGKGGKTEKKLNFSEYIEHCNELFARSYMMLNLAFKIIYG